MQKKNRKPKNEKKEPKTSRAQPVPQRQKDKRREKQFRTDLRNERTTETQSTSQALAVSNDSIVISMILETQPAAGIALGILSYALQRGWQGISNDPSSLYHAYVYLIQFIIDSTKNATPLVTSIPHFLNLIVQATKPKFVPCGAGKASYKFELNQTFVVPTYSIPMTSGGSWTLGIPSTTFVNTLWPQMQTPTAYSDQLGSVALNSLIQFITTVDERGKMCRIVQANSENQMTLDASMFAVAGGDPGSGFANLGAPRSLLTLEVPIRSPIFGCVGRPSGNSLVENNRSAAFSRAHGADPVVLGGMMAGVLQEKQIHFKKPPVFKCVDAGEFYDQLAYIAQAAAQYALTDLQVAQGIASGNTLPSDYTVPLTFQEFKILFRNVMMLANANAQYFAQGLVFQTASVSHGTFLPFKVAAGTFPNSTATLPKVPVVWTEQLNCNTMRVNVGGKGGVSNPNFIVPVIGEYEDDTLSGDDWFVTYSTNDTTATLPLFAAPPVNAKGKEKISMENPISMIDGAGGSGWVYINDTDGLNKLAELWNAWYSRVAPFIDTSDTYAVDGGVSVLSQVICTNHYVVGQEQSKAVQRDPRFKVLEVQNAYGLKKLAGITCAQKILQEPQQMTSYWIKPTNAIYTIGANATQYTGFQKMSTVYREPFQLNVTTGGFANATLSTYHVNFARTITRARNGDDSAMTKFVLQSRKAGTGGILSTLADAFVPVAAGTMLQLAKQVPY